MTALVSLSDLVNRITGGNSGSPEAIWFGKTGRVAGAAASAQVLGRWTSLWQYEGWPGGAGAAPGGTARNPTNATAGSMFQTDPGGGRSKWLLGGGCAPLLAGTLLVYDRLADISGLSGTTTTAQAITGLSAARYTGTAAAGNEVWLEINTAVGVTGTTVTASYTNQAGTAGQITPAIVLGNSGFREAQRMLPMPLVAGDTGARSVENIDLVASTGTAGDIGVVIMRPILHLPCPTAGLGALRDLIAGLPGITEVKTGACLALAWLPASITSPPEMIGHLMFVEE
jgi:hypothetical protein